MIQKGIPFVLGKKKKKKPCVYQIFKLKKWKINKEREKEKKKGGWCMSLAN